MINQNPTMPLPSPERPQPPEHPVAAGFPKPLRDVIGWTAECLQQAVGEPDSRFAGDRWFVEGEGLGQPYVRLPDGSIVEQHWLGPRAPKGIPLGQDYSVWRYNNVGAGRSWLIYIVQTDGQPVIVDVDTFPYNAIF